MPDATPPAEQRLQALEAELASTRAALARAEARLDLVAGRALIEQHFFSVQLLSPDGVTLLVNQAWERLWGVDMAYLERVGYNMLEDPLLEAQGIAPYIRRGFAGEALPLPLIEYHAVEDGRNVGNRRFVEGYIHPLRDAAGVVRQVIVLHHDVTDRVLANEHCEAQVVERTAELRREREFLQALLDNLSDGIAACDAAGELSLLNRAARTFHGRSEAPIPASDWPAAFDLYAADGVTPLAPDEVPLRRAFLGEHVHDAEMVIAPQDRPARTVMTSGQPILDAQGLKVGAVVAMHDVTEQKRLETEAVRLARERIEALEQADRLKDEFLSILSHELRTPLNAIDGYGSLLADTLDGEPRRYAEKILASSDVLLALIEDLLTVSRIQAGKFSVDREPLVFPDLVDHALATLAPAAGRKGVAVTSEVPRSLPPLSADPKRVGQVLTNLIGNALKFTPPGGQVAVRARVDGDALRIEVVDDGEGIAEADIPRLFTRFSQLDMSDTRRAGGAGLGLSIVKAIVEGHGGRVGVESEPQRGSTFWFTLPLA